MNYFFAIICWICGIICYVFPDFVNYCSNIFLGLAFMYLGNLFLKKKDDE